jgi:hypothetical protein
MKPITSLVVVFLALIAALHVLRLALQWSLVINGMTVPMWASAVAALVTAALAVMLWRESRR